MKTKPKKSSEPFILNTDTISIAEIHLAQVDRILGELITLHGPCTICSDYTEPFEKLVNSIIGQQLSAKAARTIRQRIRNCLGKICPEEISAAASEKLRECGLSTAKVRYIKALSELVQTNQFSFESLYNSPIEVVIDELVKIPGVGRWTAEMFALSTLRHANILSLGDAGLNRAVKKLYGSNASLEKKGEKWKPYCSVASWYLWRYLDANLLAE